MYRTIVNRWLMAYRRTMPQLILASQSPYRRQQLEDFGFSFRALRPAVDEEQLKRQGPSDLVQLTQYLAEKKARSLQSQFPGDLILGSDQLVDLDGRRLDKPGTFERAAEQLRAMSAKEHRLITSLAMVMGEEVRVYTDITRIRLKRLSEDLIRSYLNKDQPFDCAGSYKIEKAGLCLVESLASDDPSAIQGLPMMSLLRGLDDYKINLAELWE